MVHVLGQEGLGDMLGQGLGGGISQGIGAALSQMLEQKSQRMKASQLMEALGVGGGSSETQGAEMQQASAPAKSGIGNLTQEKVLAASLVNPQLGSTLASLYKTQQKEAQEQESMDRGQEVFDRMNELVGQGNLGFGSKAKAKVFGKQTAEDVGEFESLSGALEALLVDKVSRGTLSNSRFKYITETLLPKPNDRAATIKGKLKALSKQLGLKLPEKGVKSLDKETALEILNLAKGDKEKARKIAKTKGYEF